MKHLRDPRIIFCQAATIHHIPLPGSSEANTEGSHRIGDVYLTLDILDTECIVGDLCIIDKCGA